MLNTDAEVHRCARLPPYYAAGVASGSRYTCGRLRQPEEKVTWSQNTTYLQPPNVTDLPAHVSLVIFYLGIWWLAAHSVSFNFQTQAALICKMEEADEAEARADLAHFVDWVGALKAIYDGAELARLSGIGNVLLILILVLYTRNY
jgi:hypothetical protein